MSLPELAAADIQLRPDEAVAIVGAICRQHISGRLAGFPSPGVIRLTRDGEIVVEGPVTTGQDDVARAAHLLNDLLSGFDASPQYRASGGLRLVIARALGTLDVPPYESLEEFCSALARFTVVDVAETARALYCAWERAHATHAAPSGELALTISDVRRARRATGLTLHDIESAAEVPATQLRDLEWGYMRNWTASAKGRADVVRYARAAGLDERLVLSIVWPLIVAAAPARPVDVDTEESTALIPAPQQRLALTHPQLPAVAAVRPVRRVYIPVVAALAVLGLLVTLAIGWTRAPELRTAQAGPESTRADAPDRAPALPVGAVAPIPQQLLEQPQAPPAASADPPRTIARPRATSKPAARRASAPARRQEPRRRSPFQRELFRIVVR